MTCNPGKTTHADCMIRDLHLIGSHVGLSQTMPKRPAAICSWIHAAHCKTTIWITTSLKHTSWQWTTGWNRVVHKFANPQQTHNGTPRCIHIRNNICETFLTAVWFVHGMPKACCRSTRDGIFAAWLLPLLMARWSRQKDCLSTPTRARKKTTASMSFIARGL